MDRYNDIFKCIDKIDKDKPLGTRLQMVTLGTRSPVSCNILMILTQDERELPSTKRYIGNALHTFDNNINSITKLYYRYDEKDLQQILTDNIYDWYGKVDNNGPLFIFDPHEAIDQNNLYKIMRRSKRTVMNINLRDY